MKLIIRGILDRVFVVGLVVFLLLGSVIVLVQLWGVITGNGAMTIAVEKMLGKPTFYVAPVAGLIGFVQSYLYGWKSGD